jgi:hypothetical protein
MTGRRALFAFCWPLLQGLSYLLTEILLPVSIGVSAFLVCTQFVVWMIVESTSVPTIDPYIPRAKRPPSYLEPFLAWLGTTIDQAADKIAPFIHVRHHSMHPSYTRPMPSQPHIPYEAHCTEWFHPLARFDVVFWFHSYLFCKWKFCWWQVCHHVLALSGCGYHRPSSSQLSYLWKTVSLCNI